MEIKRPRCKQYLWAGMALLFIAGMMVATRFDFAITASLSGFHQNENGTYSLSAGFLATVLDIIGEWPSTILGAFSFIIIELNFRRKMSEKGRLVFLGISTLITALLMFYGSYKTIQELTDGKLYAGHYVIIIVCTLTLSALLRFICENISPKAVRKMFAPALFTAAAALLLLLSTELLKTVWGRVRLYEIAKMANESSIAPQKIFTPWYAPNFFSGSKSFPSGHTANAAFLLILPLWVEKFKNTAHCKLTKIAVSVWIFVMGLSRMCYGAHYLSDVLVGFAIAYAIVEVTYYLYDSTFPPNRKRRKRSVISHPEKV